MSVCSLAWRKDFISKPPPYGEGWSLMPESLLGHRLICILAQKHPHTDPQLRWDRVERLSVFQGSSPPVQGERESAEALITSVGEKNKTKHKIDVKTLVRERPKRRKG